MQKRFWKDEQLKSYRNFFCDSEKSVIFEFCNLSQSIKLMSDMPSFSKDEILELCRYVVLKNLQADCKDLTILSSAPDLAGRAMKEFNMNGKVLFPIEQMFEGRTEEKAYYIDNLLSFNEEQLSFISDNLAKANAEVYINFDRSLEDMGTLDQIYHASPARILEDFGFLDRKIWLVGCNFLDKDDASLLAGYKSSLVLTPQADMMLGRGAINICALLATGVEVKLGTGESPFVDMFEEGRLALGNTANLMLNPFALTKQQIEDMISTDKDVDEMLTEVRLEKQRKIVEKIIKGKKL